MEEQIEIFGARENNLKNIHLSFPRNSLVVITGISGSGKSSLAFDTLYAEGQRRYMESFSAYARSFIGDMERPDVDKINGLSPVISIEQKTTSRNPRSTVGTITEIYDFFRLLYARAADAYSHESGLRMSRQTEESILEQIVERYHNQKITLLAPIIKGRKGHYRELFVRLRKLGFLKVRVDGEIQEISPKMQLDRYKIHDIELVIDRLYVEESEYLRIQKSLKIALTEGKNTLIILPEEGALTFFSKNLMDPHTGIAYDEPAPNTFSFNSPYGMCPSCNGLGIIDEITRESIIPDPSLSISRGAIAPLGEYRDIWIFKKIEAVLKGFKASLTTPVEKLPEEVMHALLHGTQEEIAVPSKKYPKTEWITSFKGILDYLTTQFEEGAGSRTSINDFTVSRVCSECNGMRLKKEALHFLLDGKNISQVAQMDIRQLSIWLEELPSKLTERQLIIAHEVLKEIKKRVGFLKEVGLDYLCLDRSVKTLSGGESQRIRLATQIGTQLVGVLYILDEPSIGLHARDNERLINALRELCNLGNTVVIVEHDKDMMLVADQIIDIGPGAGRHGGKVVAQGAPVDFLTQGSLTAQYLNGSMGIPIPSVRRKGSGEFLHLKGATGHNLQNLSLALPLGTLICVTGVSGSGKSSLIHETLFPILNSHFYNAHKLPLPYEALEGLSLIDKVIEVDQSPIGRTPRSNPATYTGMFTDIRTLFSALPESKIRGYKPGRFSFNVKGGRCEECEGGGRKTIEMDFLPDVQIECPSCRGKRYNRETLEVRYKGKSISDVLDMSVEEGLEFFEAYPKIKKKLQTLLDVGLSYITIGQHATTLSGGEAQRVKLATELARKDTGKTFYILDEPTTGLHFEDIRFLLRILNRLVDKGNTVLVIEHNMDVIKVADYIIDLGPDGGAAGGYIVGEGSPEEFVKNTDSFTATFLRKTLEEEKHFIGKEF